MQHLQSILFAGIAAVSLFSGRALAEVTISQPWVRATVSGQKATGAFMQLKSDSDVRLVAVSTPVADVVEVHEMSMSNGVMKMQAVANGLPLPANQMVELKPGGYHVMLMALKRQVKPSESVALTLTFEDARKQRTTKTIEASVRELAAGGHGHH